jgi:hypothetical protein
MTGDDVSAAEFLVGVFRLGVLLVFATCVVNCLIRLWFKLRG